MRLEGIGEAAIILFCFCVLPWLWPLGQWAVQEIKTWWTRKEDSSSDRAGSDGETT